MKSVSHLSAVHVWLCLGIILISVRSLRAQEAEIATTVGKEILEALGTDAADFGGETMVKETSERLIVEASESLGSAGGNIARTQVQRIIATRNEVLIFDLKSISGRSLLLLEDVGDEALPAAVSTLTRPGVEKGIQSLGSATLKQAALVGESRLPGAGLKIVEDFKTQGAEFVGKLGEDQANSVIAGSRPIAINALTGDERSGLLNALASRPDALVFNFGSVTGPLVVIASGLVIWHGMDLTLSPDERVTERPDGTVVHEKTGVLSQAIATVPGVTHQLSAQLKYVAIALIVGASMVITFAVWQREKRLRPADAGRPPEQTGTM